MSNPPFPFPASSDLSLVELSSSAASDAQLVLAVDNAARHETLARSHDQRRSEVPGSRDNQVFRLGSAFETTAALDLCDIAMVGIVEDPIAIGWLCEAAAELDDGQGKAAFNLVDCIRHILSNRSRREYLTHRGAWVRWNFLAQAYHSGVASFEAGETGQDPAAKWRFRKVTYRQRYLVEMVGRLLAADNPDFAFPELRSAGEAHDWLRNAGGNPRFSVQPRPPKLPISKPSDSNGDR